MPIKNLFYLFAGVLVLVTAPLANAKELKGYLAHYSALLSNYVEQGERQGVKATLVDYKAWRENHLHKKALTELQKINPEILSGKEKMTFWVNAYNLLTIDLIIKTDETESIRNQGGLFKNVWKSHDWEIYGKNYTLDEIEHKILRPMGDPRIHFAINCASLSCPDLRAEPYIAQNLNAQLDEQARLFLTKKNKGLLVTDHGLKISKIFKWFAEDFGDKKGVMKFIRRQLTQSNNGNIVEYFDYNWSLNTK